MDQQPVLQEIIDNFAYLDDWEDRYRYLIELGKTLQTLAPDAHNDHNKVRGCASQVWLQTQISRNGADDPILHLIGDSDAHIVRGLVALITAIYSGQTAQAILKLDAMGLFTNLGLASHLTPQRANGVRAMVDRIKAEANAALTAMAH